MVGVGELSACPNGGPRPAPFRMIARVGGMRGHRGPGGAAKAKKDKVLDAAIQII